MKLKTIGFEILSAIYNVSAKSSFSEAHLIITVKNKMAKLVLWINNLLLICTDAGELTGRRAWTDGGGCEPAASRIALSLASWRWWCFCRQASALWCARVYNVQFLYHQQLILEMFLHCQWLKATTGICNKLLGKLRQIWHVGTTEWIILVQDQLILKNDV